MAGKSQADKDKEAEEEAQRVANEEQRRLQEEQNRQRQAEADNPNADQQFRNVNDLQRKQELEKGPIKTYRLINGLHGDDEGTHRPDFNPLVKSRVDLVKLHGADKFAYTDESRPKGEH